MLNVLQNRPIYMFSIISTYMIKFESFSSQVRRNVMDVSYHIAQYTNIIAELREEVTRLRTRLDAANHKSVGEGLGGGRSGNSLLDQ